MRRVSQLRMAEALPVFDGFEIVRILGKGCKNKEIAERMFISEKTVRHYLTSIFSKLGVDDRLELMIFSYQNGLAEVPANTKLSFPDTTKRIWK